MTPNVTAASDWLPERGPTDPGVHTRNVINGKSDRLVSADVGNAPPEVVGNEQKEQKEVFAKSFYELSTTGLFL